MIYPESTMDYTDYTDEMRRQRIVIRQIEADIAFERRHGDGSEPCYLSELYAQLDHAEQRLASLERYRDRLRAT